MHDIAGYMLCSLELNMQALFMYMYMCVYECTCVCVYVCTCTIQAFIVLAHRIHTCVDVCFSVCQQ